MKSMSHMKNPTLSESGRLGPKRIVHVVDSLEFGGLERVVSDLAMSQAQAGCKVSVFSINSTTGFRPQLEHAGIEVIVGAKQRAFDLGVLRRLRQALTLADVAHAHNFVPNYYAATALIGLGSKPVQVCTCHDMGHRLENRRLRWIFRLSLRRTALVAMVGQQVFHRYVQSGIVNAERAVTVLNGVPVQQFTPSAQRRQHARTMLGLADDAVVIGTVGRLVALKNQLQLIDQVPMLRQRCPRLRVVLVGDGPLRDTLSARVAELGLSGVVELLGARTDIQDLLQAFDIFALPSLTEGLSIALLEACASGLAVIASDVGGNPEVVRHGHTGILVQVGDAVALRENLNQLVANARLRAELGAAARNWVIANASVESLRSAYEKLYSDAMTSRT